VDVGLDRPVDDRSRPRLTRLLKRLEDHPDVGVRPDDADVDDVDGVEGGAAPLGEFDRLLAGAVGTVAAVGRHQHRLERRVDDRLLVDREDWDRGLSEEEFGDAAHHQPAQPGPAVAAHHDAVHVAALDVVQNGPIHRLVPFEDGRFHSDARVANPLGGSLDHTPAVAFGVRRGTVADKSAPVGVEDVDQLDRRGERVGEADRGVDGRRRHVAAVDGDEEAFVHSGCRRASALNPPDSSRRLRSPLPTVAVLGRHEEVGGECRERETARTDEEPEAAEL
jgi:hypothetical protein